MAQIFVILVTVMILPAAAWYLNYGSGSEIGVNGGNVGIIYGSDCLGFDRSRKNSFIEMEH